MEVYTKKERAERWQVYRRQGKMEGSCTYEGQEARRQYQALRGEPWTCT